MTQPRIAILGAGPTGLGGAYQLARKQRAAVTVLEQNSTVGGIAGSFDLAGIPVDFGSHRLHPACDREVLDDIRTLLGQDLLDRPRHGRILLRGRWIHFPLKPLDLALKLPPSFALGTMSDLLKKLLPAHPSGRGETRETFASLLQEGLGKTICNDFYFPYARKLWGVEPESLSVIQARRRISSGSLGKMIRKVVSAVPGMKKPHGSGRFYYPAKGFGQIAEAYYRAGEEAGAKYLFNTTITGIETKGKKTIHFIQDGTQQDLEVDYIWSTIPVTNLVELLSPEAPAEVLDASRSLGYRAMILIYLVLEQDQFTEYDAHYFPESAITISRLSEPKNYSPGRKPNGRTVLCAELPCSQDDAVWRYSNQELAELMKKSLADAGIPVQAPVMDVVARRLQHAYPLYTNNYDMYLDRVDNWLSSIEGLVTFGRQGLFAHDNVHHALFVAYAAVKCLNPEGQFDRDKWEEYREVFKSHVVED